MQPISLLKLFLLYKGIYQGFIFHQRVKKYLRTIELLIWQWTQFRILVKGY